MIKLPLTLHCQNAGDRTDLLNFCNSIVLWQGGVIKIKLRRGRAVGSR